MKSLALLVNEVCAFGANEVTPPKNISELRERLHFFISEASSLAPRGDFVAKSTPKRALCWPAGRDSNPRSPESESGALSGYATGGNICNYYITKNYFFNTKA